MDYRLEKIPSGRTSGRTHRSWPIGLLWLAALLGLAVGLPGNIVSGTAAGARSQTVSGALTLARPGRIRSNSAAQIAAADSQIAGPPYLVKDINPMPYRGSFGVVGGLTNLNGMLFFPALDDRHGVELWKSDGTAAGTTLVKDIAPGVRDSTPSNLTNANGTLFFSADDGSNGIELWKSDGTAAGTALVKDITPGASHSALSNFTDVSGTLFFAVNRDSGSELWKSDGTAAGTRMIKPIPAIRTYALPGQSAAQFVNVGGTLFFTTPHTTGSDLLWKSDGTAAGTVLIKTFPDQIYQVVDLNGTLYFNTYDGSSIALWKSDGTAAGTVLIGGPRNVFQLSNVNGTLFFVANGPGSNRTSLWKSDGTIAGTVAIREIPSGLASWFTNVNGRLFFTLNDGTSPTVLWKSDGTTAGTAPVKAVGTQAYGVGQLTNVNGTLFFVLQDNNAIRGLWKSDGTANGTVLVKATAALGIPNPSGLTAMDGKLFFILTGDGISYGLWTSDGSTTGTVPLKSSTSFPEGESRPRWLINVNGTLFFAAGDGARGWLWRSNGTAASTSAFKDTTSFSLEPHAAANGKLFFATYEGGSDQLWMSDGTTTGTVPLMMITSPASLAAMSGRVFFLRDSNGATALWASDGTAAGTALAANMPPTTSSISDLTAVDGRLFFNNHTIYGGRELWTSDGTAAGTRMVKPFEFVECFKGTCYPETITQLTAERGRLFFSALESETRTLPDLWISDGTLAGTVQLTGLGGAAPAAPADLTAVNGTLFFTAQDGSGGRELWASDGTVATTRRVADILPGPNSSSPSNLANVDGTLFFTANDGIHGTELWKSDGTARGTVLVADIVPGLRGSLPTDIIDANGQVAFAASSASGGRELWTSDGTAVGTRQIGDIAPGAANANPADLTVAGAQLFFSANDGSHGTELWALPLLSRPFRRTNVRLGALIQAEDFDRGGERLAYHDRDPFNRGGAYRLDETVDLQADAGSSGGAHLAWTQAGEWLNYTVDVAQTQTYTLTVRVAAQGQGGTFHIAVDGVDRTGPLHIPDTGGWFSWQTIEKSGLRLAAGRHTLRLVLDADGATSGVGNIDWISLLGPVKYRVLLPVVD